MTTRTKVGWWLLPGLLFCFGCWPYCQWGGGYSDSSVRVPGEEGVFLKAKDEGKGLTAKIELERSSRSVSGGHEVTYVFSKTLIEQELRLTINEGGQGLVFILSKHDEASSHDTHELSVAPDGQRLAYKLGAGPWHAIYLLPDNKAVHGPAMKGDLDWAGAPTLLEAFVDVFAAQNLRLDGRSAFHMKAPMLAWLKAEHGQLALAEMLFKLLALDDYRWDRQTKELDQAGRARLQELLRKEVLEGTPTHHHYSSAWSQGALDLSAPENLEHVKRGIGALSGEQSTLLSNGIDLAAYLAAFARAEPIKAAEISCLMVSHDNPPYALAEARPLLLLSLAVTALANKKCAGSRPFVADPCHEDAKCGDDPCSTEELLAFAASVLERKLEKPEPGKTPSDPAALAKLVLANRVVAATYYPSEQVCE